MVDDQVVEARTWSVVASPRSFWTFVLLRDNAGRCGVGETAGFDAVILERSLADAGRAAIGRKAAELAWGRTVEPDMDPLRIRAASAIAQAASDLAAQAAQRPLAAYYVESPASAVALYANLNRGLALRAPDDFARRAREAAGAGFGAVKIAPFDDLAPGSLSAAGRDAFAKGLARVDAVRSALPPGRRVMVDCHWRFDDTGAVSVIEELARRGVDWIECPIAESSGSIDALVRLRSRAHAAGTRLAGADEIDVPTLFRAIVDAGAYDVVMPDVKHLGGPHATLALARRARAVGLDVSLHNPTGPVAHAHSVHLTAAIDGALPLETQYAETPLFAAMLDRSAARPARGVASIDSTPGLGLTVPLDRRVPGVSSSSALSATSVERSRTIAPDRSPP